MQDQGTAAGQGGGMGTGQGRADLSKVHVFESPGSTEFGFTCDASGANLPPPKAGAWKHWRMVDIGSSAEPQVGVDPEEIREGIRARGYFTSIITDMPTI